MQPEDEAAQGELVRQHGARMLASARRILQSEPEARDAVQEAFLRGFAETSPLDPAERVAGRLQALLIEVSLAKLRAQPGAPEAAIEELLPHFDPKGQRIEAASEPLPARRREPNELVRGVIAQLPEIYRIALLLRDVEGLSAQEAARALGIEESAAKMRLHRARQAMLTLLQRRLAGGAPGAAPSSS